MLVGFLALPGVPVSFALADGTNDQLLFSCVPQTGVPRQSQGGMLELARNKPTSFDCEITNRGAERPYSVLLTGKQINTHDETTASVVQLDVLPGSSVQTVMTFPGVFQADAYQYRFSLTDTESKRTVDDKNFFVGQLVGESTARIASVETDKDSYQWSDPLTLTVTLDVPKGTDLSRETLSLRVSMRDRAGKECAVLVDGKTLTTGKEVYRLQFPKSSRCTNALTLRLTDGDDIVDERTVAVNLPQDTTPTTDAEGVSAIQRLFDGVTTTALVASISGVLFVLLLVGFVLIRRKRNGTV